MKKGFTLLEILVSITLFVMMVTFLTQLSQSAFRHNKKVHGEFEFSRKTVNVLDVMEHDFYGIVMFFDLNRNMSNFFRVKDKFLQDRDVSFETQKYSFFLFNTEFDFIGKESEITFTTSSMVESPHDKVSYQIIHIRYILDKCMDLETDQRTQCLFRLMINPEDNDKIIEKYVLFRGVESLQFFYLNEGEWMREWHSLLSDVSVKVLLPNSVRMDIKWSHKNKVVERSYYFPVSSPLVRYQGRELVDGLLSFTQAQSKALGLDEVEREAEKEEAEKEGEEDKQKEEGIDKEDTDKKEEVPLDKKPLPEESKKKDKQ